MSYFIRAAALPKNFRGTPQELFEAMLDRIEIVSDALSFVIQDVAPTENVGPWLKEGKKWYVWSTESNPAGEYVPLDISDSSHEEIFVGKEDVTNLGNPYGLPAGSRSRCWLQTDSAGTEIIALWYNFGGTLGWQVGLQPAAAWTVDLIPANSVALSRLEAVGNEGDIVYRTARTYATRASTFFALNPGESDSGKTVRIGADGSATLFDYRYPLVSTTVGTISNVDVDTTHMTELGGYNTLPPAGNLVGSITVTPAAIGNVLRFTVNAEARVICVNTGGAPAYPPVAGQTVLLGGVFAGTEKLVGSDWTPLPDTVDSSTLVGGTKFYWYFPVTYRVEKRVTSTAPVTFSFYLGLVDGSAADIGSAEVKVSHPSGRTPGTMVVEELLF